ncbi:hypothetical protein M0R19_03950 [Candidatus Pacearchaeota archaeon]|nr:hypothetical protein [Candidatus Pacearchaeota archaeon]
MKVRKGFVSNSSTTSFCIYGIYAPFDEMFLTNKEDEYDEEDEVERIYDICDEHGISFERTPNDNYYYVGLDIRKMKKEETLKEFQDKTQKLLKELFPNDIFKKDENYDLHVDGFNDNF